MIVVSDSLAFARKVLPIHLDWRRESSEHHPELSTLLKRIIPFSTFYSANSDVLPWHSLILVEKAGESQYDALIEIARGKEFLPDGILCLAGSGKRFHGFRNRPWVSLPGNIHLSVLLSPRKTIPRFDTGFLMVAAVSVVETIDTIRGLKGKAGIKWINDILIDNSKVCGVLAHTLSQGDRVTHAILGIGLNVEATPTVQPTRYVPLSAALKDFAADIHLHEVFFNLLTSLWKNYQILMAGNADLLFKMYKDRSLVLNRRVSIWKDPVNGAEEKIAEGVVTDIGRGLELYLEGTRTPISHGRLALEK